MTFQAYCPFCEKAVAAEPMLGGNDLRLALADHAEIEVMHSTENDGDHIWNLNDQDKEHLRDTKAKGTAG
jgi:hypothetical protein